MSPAARLWRSLEQLAADPVFMARAAEEFPGLAAALAEPLDRRQALRLMAASLVLAGVGGCQPSEPLSALIPPVRQPPNLIPGVPNYYASAHVLGGYASGIVIKHHMGRPVRVDGNPHHPSSLGAVDVFAQAQLLDFYDPDRAAEIGVRGEPSERGTLERVLAEQRAVLAASAGAGLRILSGTVSSPTLAAQLAALRQRYPQAAWIQWEPISCDAQRRGTLAVYGRVLDVLAHVERADVLLALDSDLISETPGHLRYAREFAARRNPTRTERMSRVYAIEPTPTLLGSVADHRFIAQPAELPRLLAAIEAGVRGETVSDAPAWLVPLVADLRAARGRALVHAGRAQPAEVHARVHVLNELLQGRGTTYELIEPVAQDPELQQPALEALIADMHAGRVQHLLMLDCNPLYTAAAYGFAEALARVPFSLALAGSADESARAATWFVPKAHAWESWGDARAHDGSVTLLQPQAQPLYAGLDALELIGLYLEPTPPAAEQRLRAHWREQWGGEFEARWSEALARGVIDGTASAVSEAPARSAPTVATEAAVGTGLTLLLRPDPSLWDGRFANQPWLQELPRPLSQLVWDNPLLLAPELAARLELKNGDRVRARVGAASVEAPVWVLPGQARDAVSAWLGSGRRAAGSIGNGVGVDYYPLSGARGELTLQRLPGHVALASTVHHNLLFETPAEILRHGTLAEYSANPRFAADPPASPPLYRTHPPGPAAWAMSVDLNACIGCNACIIACQAENNIPVVGKQQVLNEREMHWLRIDRYYEGDATAPESFAQPVLCMHCEQAPCEVVCPVGATLHDAEGLNTMVYNRCVGTRFCSNNCPYKVRRFNYFGYGEQQARPPESWNPEVTVRARGVMEKCSYCVQRIAAARILADRSGAPLPEVKTACQSACPTQAFTFGNLADEASAVAQRKRSPLTFAMLVGQNTHPRTTYEALVRNPNPAIARGGT